MFDSVFTKEEVTLVNLAHIPTGTAFLAELFCALGKCEISVDMISRPTNYSADAQLAFTVDDDDLSAVLAVLGRLSERHRDMRCSFSAGNCKISVKDSTMADRHFVCGRFFDMLADEGVEVLTVTTDFDEISILVSGCELEKALHAASR